VIRLASLQARLLVLVLGLSAGVWLLAAALTWRDTRHEVGELLDSHLAQSAALLVAQGSGLADEEHDIDAPVLHRYGTKVAFQVFHEGRLVVASANAPASPMVSGAHAVQGFHTARLSGEDWRIFATRGHADDVQVFVGERLDARDEIAGAVLRSMLWPVAIALPVLAIAGWWSVRVSVRPLRVLGRTLAARSPEVLAPVQLEAAPTEVLPVVAALNALFSRITQLLERERRFTGDAAHELRTPIAAIRAQAQVALGATDDAQRRHALAATVAGCDRAARLVEQLLTLSRLEANGSQSLGPVDLGAVVRRVTTELAPESVARKQFLRLDVEQSPAVVGDETLLAVLVRNLVDNAIRYAPAAAPIDVDVRRDGDAVLLTIEDGGRGLADQDLQRLGERFFRADTTAASGSGLGWSIAQRIAQVHQALLVADRSPALGGMRARARFPLHHEVA
jgi:two-component system, OmpR family, sensor histidine kinase QseC